MAGILDESYGVAAQRREKLIKRIVIGSLAVLIVATVLYFSFRTRPQEHVIDQFLTDLRNQQFQAAYNMWCTSDDPCRFYPLQSFTEDWGPASKYPNPSAFKIQNVDYCDEGVVFWLTYPNAEDIGLWVKRSNNVISFAPWTRCPGRHLQIGAFLHSLFS